MNKFKKVSAAALAGLVLGLVPGLSHGLGFGQPSSRAVLGEKLLFRIPLHLDAGEDVTKDCLVGDVYLGDDKLPSGSVAVSLERVVTGDVTAEVRTLVAVNEPVVTLYLVAGCKTKVNRKFVLFVDPPAAITPAVSDAASVGEAPDESEIWALKPDASPQAAHKVAKAPKTASSASRHVGGRAATLASRGHAASKASSNLARDSMRLSPMLAAPGSASKLAALTKSDSGGRLLLDPVEQDAMAVPSLHMAMSMGGEGGADTPQILARRAAAAALWQALNASPEQMARDRQRMVELEQRLTSLRKEGELARQSIDSLQVRAREAEDSRTPKWLLGLLVLLFLAAVGVAVFLYLKLRQSSAHGRWWQGEQEGMGAVVPDAAHALHDEASRQAADGAPRSALAAEQDEPGHWGEPPAMLRSLPRPQAQSPAWATAGAAKAAGGVASAPSAASNAPASFVSKPARTEPLREVSVEELIDLEQQAEFFVVLGQDDAAIDLLEGHVQSTTGASPLPFLKLLEIYQRLGRRDDYERVQSAFNQRFNAYAPAWEADLQQGHTLTDYPGVVERIQALWAAPTHAMEVLEKSLTRPDHDAETFDLPAYRELLFLYAVARDLSEREAKDRNAVDLLLPVSEQRQAEPLPGLQEVSEVEPLMATRPVKAQPHAMPSISLDLQLDDLPLHGAAASATPPIVSNNMPPKSGPSDLRHRDLPGGDK